MSDIHPAPDSATEPAPALRRPVPPPREERPEEPRGAAVSPVPASRRPSPFRTPSPPPDPGDAHAPLVDLARRHLFGAVGSLETAYASGDEEALAAAVADLQALDDEMLAVLPGDDGAPGVEALRRAVIVIGDQVGGLLAAPPVARAARVDAVRRALAGA